jgi:hypothetical protein
MYVLQVIDPSLVTLVCQYAREDASLTKLLGQAKRFASFEEAKKFAREHYPKWDCLVTKDAKSPEGES